MSHEKAGLDLLNTETFKGLFPYKGVEESYQKALGALVIRFSLLHYLLESFSREVFGMSIQTATIVLKDLPFTGLIERLRKCTRHRMWRKSDQNEFLSILERAQQTAEKRNEFTHALWLINEGQPVFCYRRRKKEHSQAPSVGEINELTRSIILVTGDLMNFEKRQPLTTPEELDLAPLQENQPKPQ